jgi:hypothetical protein
MSSIDGEYRLLGRLGAETENVFNEYGSGPEDAVQIVGGGRQDVEFIDGLRFSILSDQNLTMNVNFFSPIPPSLVPTGMTSLCKRPLCKCRMPMPNISQMPSAILSTPPKGLTYSLRDHRRQHRRQHRA